MKKVLRKVPAALLVLVLVVSLFPVAALAAEGPSVSLPASVAVTGEDLPDPGEVYKLCLTARNGAPMPEGTVDGTSVTRLEAMRGRTIRSNTSGYTGVYLDRRSGKWTAQITFRRKTYTLGRFDTDIQ